MAKEVRTIDGRSSGVGDLAVALWIAEGAIRSGEEVLFVRGSYDQVVEAFGHRFADEPSSSCMKIGGESEVYSEELRTAVGDVSPRTLRWQRTVGWDFAPVRPKLSNLNPVAIEWAKNLVGSESPVVIAPKAAHGPRSLPLQKWIRTAWALQEKGIRTIAIDRDKEVIDAFPFFAFGYDWHHVIALLSMSCVVAGNDSGISHLSATIGKPTVVAMGPTIESIIFGHCQDVVKSLGRRDVECFGCHFRYEKGYRVACDRGCEALSMIGWNDIRTEIERTRSEEIAKRKDSSVSINTYDPPK